MLVMVTLVMIGLYIMNVMVSMLVNDPLRLTAFTVLFFIHLMLYWMILNFIQSEQRTLGYLLAQGMLAFVIVLISGNVYLAIGLFSAVSGTAVGMLGRNRLAFAGVVLYIFLATGSVLLLSDFGTFRDLLPVLLGAVAFSAFFAYLFHRQAEASDRAQGLLQNLEDAHKQLAEYALEVENLTLTTERQRMARELHDTLAQGLAGLILQLEAADSHLGSGHSQRAQAIVQQAMVRARTTLADARSAIDDLRTSQSSIDINTAIREETKRFTAITNIDCKLELHAPRGIPAQIAEVARRAISEGLLNIAKHAQASQVSVGLVCESQLMQIEISDNGVGFNPGDAISRSGHYGLLGMRERARILGGVLSIESALAQGTTLRLTLPLRPADD